MLSGGMCEACRDPTVDEFAEFRRLSGKRIAPEVREQIAKAYKTETLTRVCETFGVTHTTVLRCSKEFSRRRPGARERS